MDDITTYNETLSTRLALIQETMSQKNAEYSQTDLPYHNFDAAAQMNDTTPEQALWGMLIKHIVSVRDMVHTGQITPYMVREKIGDCINYLILLEGLMKRRMPDEEAKTTTQ